MKKYLIYYSVIFLTGWIGVYAQSGTVKSNQTLVITPQHPHLHYDRLIMEDGSRIVFQQPYSGYQLTVRELYVQGTAFIEASSLSVGGYTFNNGKAKNGDNDQSGYDGKDGQIGAAGHSATVSGSVFLELGFESVDQLIIVAQGGCGGEGQKGMTGGDGYRAACGDGSGHRAGNGGRGGQGGRGGNGGESTKLTIEYSEKSPVTFYYFDTYNDRHMWNQKMFHGVKGSPSPGIASFGITYALENDTLFAYHPNRMVRLDSLSKMDSLYVGCFMDSSIDLHNLNALDWEAKWMVQSILMPWNISIDKFGGARIVNDSGILKLSYPPFVRSSNEFTDFEYRLLGPPPKEAFEFPVKKGVYIYYAGGLGGFGGLGGNGGLRGAGIHGCKPLKNWDDGRDGSPGPVGVNGQNGKPIKPIVTKR